MVVFKLDMFLMLWLHMIANNVLRDFPKVGDFTTNVHKKHAHLIYEKLSYKTLSR